MANDQGSVDVNLDIFLQKNIHYITCSSPERTEPALLSASSEPEAII